MIDRTATIAAANAIVTSADTGTYRPLLAWALGALEVGHASLLTAYWRTSDARELSPGEGGGSVERGRWLHYTRHHVELSGGDLARPLAATWVEIAALLRHPRVCGELVAECHAAMAERRAADLGDHQRWWSIEERCRRAAQAVWAVCRPVDPGQQLGLFDGVPS